jgi:hypothetical protein
MGAAPVTGITITGSNLRTRIIIPSGGARLGDLIRQAEPDLAATVMTVLILGRLPTATPGAYTERGGFTVADPRPGQATPNADDYQLRGEPVAPGEDYTSPSVGDLDSFVKAGVDTNANVVLFW